jgi:hypothetical protein
MSELTRIGDLEIDLSPSFERRIKVVHRIAGFVGLLLVVLAFLGLFGEGGPLAHATATSADGSLSVDYDRFNRTEASTSFQVSLTKGSGQTNIAIAGQFLQNASINSITPQPSSETVLPDRVLFTIQQRAPAQIQITITPAKIGAHRVTIYSHDASVSFTPFTYP